MDANDDFQRRFISSTGRLRAIPKKQHFRNALLKYCITKFSEKRHYSESEVNALLQEITDDYAWLRRMLVDNGVLRRDPYGRDYYLDAAEIEDSDVPSVEEPQF